MKKKNVTWSIKPNEKNKIYLERLGFVDGRTGRTRPEANLNEFLNHCITLVCESGRHQRTSDLASSEELHLAWKKYQLGLKARKIAQLQKEIIIIGNMKTERESKESAKEIMISTGAAEELLDWE